MSPETQDLELFFQRIQHAHNPEEQVPEFDAFFEKLSSLDNQILTPETGEAAAAQPVRPAQPAQPAQMNGNGSAHRQGTGNGRQKPARRKQGMQVLRSDHLDNMNDRITRTRKIQNGMLTALKLGVAGLLLFGVGLASGWMALSLPNRIQDGPTSVFDIPTTVEAVSDPAMMQAETESMAGGAIVRDDSRVAPAESAAVPAKAKSKSTAAVSDQTPSKSGAKGTDGRQFAIQVGACHSPACVERYRKLLLPHVKSEAIQVIERTDKETQATIQRIRVISPTRSEARKVKAELAAADARFKDAYVVALRKSPAG